MTASFSYYEIALRLWLPYLYRYLDEHPELGVQISQFSFTSPKGRTDALAAGVSNKRLLKNETQPSKKLKGNPEMKTAGHGQPPRPRPLNGEGPHAKSKNLSAWKLNSPRQDKSKFGKLHGSKGAPHPMGVKKEKFEADRGAR